MKELPSLSFVALALGAAALVLSLVGRSSSGHQEASAPVAVGVGDSFALRVEELADENRDLRERLSALELRPVSGPGGRAPVASGIVSREEFEVVREEVRGLLAGRSSVALELAGDPNRFKEQMASTLDEIRKDETADKVRTWQEERFQQLDQTMPNLEIKLELTPQQSRQLRSALMAQYDREAELTRRWQTGEDPAVLGELKRSDHEAHLTELSGILSLDQLERYSGLRRAGGK